MCRNSFSDIILTLIFTHTVYFFQVLYTGRGGLHLGVLAVCHVMLVVILPC